MAPPQCAQRQKSEATRLRLHLANFAEFLANLRFLPTIACFRLLVHVLVLPFCRQFSGKVVEQAGAETSLFGSDANALFDVIEKNKKKAAEAAAALAADDEDGDGEDGEGAEGENSSGGGESGEAA